MRRNGGLTLIEVIVMILVVAITLSMAVLLFSTDRGRSKLCMENLAQIGKACFAYSQSNNEYFPARSQSTNGSADVFLPMPSLALLYPSYLVTARVFSCPQTKDRPFFTYVPSSSAPGGMRGVDLGSGSGSAKSSYFYDERTSVRACGPNQPLACDADGTTWETARGLAPTYPTSWTRSPSKPNHREGQCVLCFDGHVEWYSTNYSSVEPNDNIFCPNGGISPNSGQWGADTDAYLWDGVNPRTVELDGP